MRVVDRPASVDSTGQALVNRNDWHFTTARDQIRGSENDRVLLFAVALICIRPGGTGFRRSGFGGEQIGCAWRDIVLACANAGVLLLPRRKPQTLLKPDKEVVICATGGVGSVSCVCLLVCMGLDLECRMETRQTYSLASSESSRGGRSNAS